jgi:hypothetical protein
MPNTKRTPKGHPGQERVKAMLAGKKKTYPEQKTYLKRYVFGRVGSQSCLMCFREIEIFSRMTLVR